MASMSDLFGGAGEQTLDNVGLVNGDWTVLHLCRQ